MYRYFFFPILLLFSSCNAQHTSTDESEKSKSTERPTNRLALASSPYLLQHQYNPVDWHEWGNEALEKAKKENKPMIISIGYSACHWCHVMEHESFEDEEVANFMNDNFISIKVDREERPDIDQIYMDACQLISGRGGWPLNAIALPDGRPFFAGTYFNKAQWLDLLSQVKRGYETKHDEILKSADQIMEGISKNDLVQVNTDEEKPYNKETYNNYYNIIETILDKKWGGFNRAPKFPLPINWELMLQTGHLTQNQKATNDVLFTLDKIAMGGIYDQSGGGWARYSTDAQWLVPHFEKMLYDNGQLISLYAHAYQINASPLYESVIRQSLDFIERELLDDSGGFYSALNADSEGEEGKFYIWTKEELESIWTDEVKSIAMDFYRITKLGNWEHGQNILHFREDKKTFAEKNKITLAELNSILDKAHAQVMTVRDTRIRPSTDDKILTSWNALMLTGYIDAYKALGDEQYLKTAIKNAKFIEKHLLQPDGSLLRNYKNGKASIHAFLDDYALLADAYLALYQSTFDINWLHLSKQLADYTIEHFYDDHNKVFFYTSDLSEKLITRKYELSDNVIPGSNSVLANVLHDLGQIHYDQLFLDLSEKMLTKVRSKIKQSPPYYANWGILMGKKVYGQKEVAIIGKNADSIRKELQKKYSPDVIYLGGKNENLPLLEGKLQKGKTYIYVCENKTCKRPVEKISEALELLK